ncbi:MAG TPA: DUF2802 domain-containing protein [Bdellovibrionales bacterium]|nr:hypothetical protein [Pseudobdellovibrionaceae bacterium]HAG92198.1 DUF2802 domain-containing protein [Bdellovibrionales bacterium]
MDIFLAVGIYVLWTRLKRPPQDDPRLSRGLQLLQSKITVLEDLSDRTDVQVKQLAGLLDQKTRVIQDKIVEADRHNYQIHESMQKSLEVAEIFQDKIPHEEILERQKTIRYVKAARMANSGASVDEISAQVDLPREQLELIAKVNRDQLMFDEEALPEWAKKTVPETAPQKATTSSSKYSNFVEDEIPRESLETLDQLSQKFKEACKEFDDSHVEEPPKYRTEPSKTTEALRRAAEGFGKKLADSASHLLEPKKEEIKRMEEPKKAPKNQIQKVQFPKI